MNPHPTPSADQTPSYPSAKEVADVIMSELKKETPSAQAIRLAEKASAISREGESKIDMSFMLPAGVDKARRTCDHEIARLFDQLIEERQAQSLRADKAEDDVNFMKEVAATNVKRFEIQEADRAALQSELAQVKAELAQSREARKLHREACEKAEAELAAVKRELEACNDLCGNEDGGGTVSQVLARKITALAATVKREEVLSNAYRTWKGRAEFAEADSAAKTKALGEMKEEGEILDWLQANMDRYCQSAFRIVQNFHGIRTAVAAMRIKEATNPAPPASSSALPSLPAKEGKA